MNMRGTSPEGYEVWGKLSSGGMSDVWLAKNTRLALPVVLKTLQGTDPADIERRASRLHDEARLMARLSSPRVVRVLDVGSHPQGAHGVPYLVEEYVDELNLGELDTLRRAALRRPLPLSAIAEKLGDACEGLHAAHQAGVVHRDVKPRNIFGATLGHVKVGDFGVSLDRSETSGYVAAGTLAFMAPEQLAGEPIDRRADVWSLGASAFALRYGRAPFASWQDALDRGATPSFPPAQVPEEAYFQHVVARMLARRPDARYPNLLVARQHLRAVEAATRVECRTSRVAEHAYQVDGTRVSFEVGDLATTECDAVVNSAYSEMQMRSGVGDALRRAGGDAIEAEAVAWGERALGDAVVTGAGALPCRAVIHAVGAWNEVSCVARATQRALLHAEEQSYARIALPAVGTGRGRVSLESCADTMVGTLRAHLALGGSRLREVRFMLLDSAALSRFGEVAHAVLSGLENVLDDCDGTSAVDPGDSGSAPTVFAFSAKPAARRAAA